MSTPAALLQALRLVKQPEFLEELRTSPLPDGMSVLIRIVSDEDYSDIIERRAASVFLQEVCLFEGADVRRRLGLTPQDDHTTARSHHRLLMKWLHPDRNPEQQLLAERVNSAWTALKHASQQWPTANSDNAHVPIAQKIPRSRFPLFLILLIIGSALLLAVSFLPEAPVYSNYTDFRMSDIASQDTPAALTNRSLMQKPEVQTRLQKLTPRIDYASKISAPSASASNQVQPNSIRQAEPVLYKQDSVMQEVSAESLATDISIAPSLDQVEMVLQQFRIRYSQGDVQAFMRLFSPNVISLAGGYDVIAADYGRLFRNTRRRDIAFINPRWQVNEDTRRLRAGFLAQSVKISSATPVNRLGTIEVLFVQERGETVIVELLVME
jgi:hypothetical protein